MPVAVNAIDQPQPIAILLVPARPLPAAPERPASNLPQQGGAPAAQAESMAHWAAIRIRGVIGSSATIGGNAATIGAPGILGMAREHGASAARDAFQAIGRNVDARA